jgi:Pathogenicity locus
MPKTLKKVSPTARLEDLPNIGTSIAGDLRGLGIHSPAELATRDPLATYLRLSSPMGQRHDPCVLYTLMAARHYLDTGEALVWWKFTDAGKRLLGVPVKARRK